MADQVETTKVVKYVLTGPSSDEAAVSKVIMYLLLEPGDIVAGDTTSQGHVFGQILRRS